MRRETYQNGLLVHVEELPDPVLEVPQAVTARQAKSALLLSGRMGNTFEAVESAAIALFNGLPEPQRSLGKIAWLTSNDFERKNAWVIGMGQALGMTPAELDQLFLTASSL